MASSRPPVALLLPGQGSQYRHMAGGLYRADPVFAAEIDEVFDLMGALGDEVRADWLADRPTLPLDHVLRAQPLLYAVDYALGRLVLGWGVRPVAVLGHSMGELVAAALTGVFTPADAVRLVCERVRSLAAAPPGGMVAVAASVAEVTPYLGGEVVVGAVNAPRQTIIAGPDAPLRAATGELSGAGFLVRTVPATTAFHSPSLAGLARAAVPSIAATAMRPPATPMYAGYRGTRMSDETATDAAYWAAQPAEPVLFWPALQALLDDVGTGPEPLVLCETGPGTMLSAVAMRHPAVAAGRARVVTMLPPPRTGPADEVATVRTARERLTAA